MIAELAKTLPNFTEVAHTRCFLHIVNLVAKSVLRQFDIRKKRDDEHLDKAEQELRNLAGDVDLENKQAGELLEQRQINGEIDQEWSGGEAIAHRPQRAVEDAQPHGAAAFDRG